MTHILPSPQIPHIFPITYQGPDLRPISQDCDLAKDRSFDMSSIEGAEPLAPSKGLEKLLREMGDVTCDYSINPPP